MIITRYIFLSDCKQYNEINGKICVDLQHNLIQIYQLLVPGTVSISFEIETSDLKEIFEICCCLLESVYDSRVETFKDVVSLCNRDFYLWDDTELSFELETFLRLYGKLQDDTLFIAPNVINKGTIEKTSDGWQFYFERLKYYVYFSKTIGYVDEYYW